MEIDKSQERQLVDNRILEVMTPGKPFSLQDLFLNFYFGPQSEENVVRHNAESLIKGGLLVPDPELTESLRSSVWRLMEKGLCEDVIGDKKYRLIEQNLIVDTG